MFNATKAEIIGTSTDQRNQGRKCTFETGMTNDHCIATDSMENSVAMLTVETMSATRLQGETTTMIVLGGDKRTSFHGITKLSAQHAMTLVEVLILKPKDIVRRDTQTVIPGIDMTPIIRIMLTKAPPSDGRRDSTNFQRNILATMVLRGKGTSVLKIGSNEGRHAVMTIHPNTREITDTGAVLIEKMMMNTGIAAVKAIVMRRMKTTDTMPRPGNGIDLKNRGTGPEIVHERYL